jgi:mono/diheme cytochrome c family protein
MRIATIAACAVLLSAATARADTSSPAAGNTTLSETDGANIYQHICQGCHMADARGATGAGTIPALAGNPKLQSTGYPVYIVLNGLGGMPPVGGSLDDGQVAAVVNFVTTHFGNHATDSLTAGQVHAMRPPASHYKVSE